MLHPYSHLVPFNLFPALREDYQQALRKNEQVEDSFERAQKQLALSKKFLSHLTDPKLPVPGLLPFEVYIDDFLEDAARLDAEIKERERRGDDRLKVEVVVHLTEGTSTVMAELVGYDAAQRKYKVQY